MKKNVTKDELQYAISKLHKILDNAIAEAKTESIKYSADRPAQLAFEVGYLGGTVKNALFILDTINRK
jgi:hypothetical protein